jgi:hypothetical protein
VYAIGHCHFDIFRWAKKNGFAFDDDDGHAVDAALEASKYGHTEALEWLQDEVEKGDFDEIFEDDVIYDCRSFAAAYGQVDILRWFERFGGQCSGEAAIGAIQGGHVDTVVYLLQNGCPDDDDDELRKCCKMAAFLGHLSILKLLVDFAYDEKRKCDSSMIDYAAAGGHLETVEWVHENQCTFRASTCNFAAGSGKLDILQWLRAKGCPWDERTTIYASTKEIYDWAKENGCPMAKGKPREYRDNEIRNFLLHF